jgi:hypothetical protein
MTARGLPAIGMFPAHGCGRLAVIFNRVAPERKHCKAFPLRWKRRRDIAPRSRRQAPL